MKSTLNKDIAHKTHADLAKMVADKREALRLFRFGTAGAKAKNVKEGKSIRKDIARILTAMNAQKTA
ncbi:MAG: 50S ribosomal protein L29 [Candidatus Pacebacteria bacterium]|nr:50S ribosomal protein L29 [Candidatus Paceibacterota bacterium]